MSLLAAFMERKCPSTKVPESSVLKLENQTLVSGFPQSWVLFIVSSLCFCLAPRVRTTTGISDVQDWNTFFLSHDSYYFCFVLSNWIELYVTCQSKGGGAQAETEDGGSIICLRHPSKALFSSNLVTVAPAPTHRFQCLGFGSLQMPKLCFCLEEWHLHLLQNLRRQKLQWCQCCQCQWLWCLQLWENLHNMAPIICFCPIFQGWSWQNLFQSRVAS